MGREKAAQRKFGGGSSKKILLGGAKGEARFEQLLVTPSCLQRASFSICSRAPRCSTFQPKKEIRFSGEESRDPKFASEDEEGDF